MNRVTQHSNSPVSTLRKIATAWTALSSRRPTWSEQLAETDLEQPIKEKISQVVQQTRLTRREKSDVVQELVAHFYDGIEAGVSPERLCQEFGDAATTAKMIRKAKFRCRGASWHLALWFWRGIAASVAIYIIAAVWLSVATPNISQDYWPAINRLEDQSDASDTAWPIYESALLQLTGEPPAAVQPGKRIPGHITPDWLRQNQRAIELIRQAASREQLGVVLGKQSNYRVPNQTLDWSIASESSIYPVDDAVVSSPLPHLAELLSLQPVLMASCKLNIHEGKPAEAFADVTALLDMAGQLEQTLYGVFPGKITAIDLAAECLVDSCRGDQSLWNDEQLEQLAGKLAALQIDLTPVLAESEILFEDMMQRLYSRNGHLTSEGIEAVQKMLLRRTGAVDSAAERLLERLAAPVAYFSLPKRSEVASYFYAVQDRAAEILRQPLWELREEPSRDIYSGVDRYCMAAAIAAPFQRHHDLLRLNRATAQGRLDAASLAVALQRYRRKYDRFPEQLVALAPEFLSRLPPDRINGLPLLMTVVDGQPVVYSRGRDTDDDHGYVPKAGFDAGNYRYYPAWPDPVIDHDGDWVLVGVLRPKP